MASALLEEAFPSVTVEGEIANFKHHGSGHMYFSVRDGDSSVSCVMYRTVNSAMNFIPEDGMKVVLKGKLQIFSRTGRYQLICWKARPGGKGDLEKKFSELKKKLSEKGYFDPAVKKEIPALPAEIAIITSPTGAAVRDMLRIIGRRFPGMKVNICPSAVQGAGAHREIAQALRTLNENRPGLDLVVLTRGGGSLEDLWPFNEEEVADEIFRSKLPVISAVGHETDMSISDMAADLRAATPSAAAELITQGWMMISERTDRAADACQSKMTFIIKNSRLALRSLENTRYFMDPYAIVGEALQRLDMAVQYVNERIRNLVREKKLIFSKLISEIEALSPRAVMERGYSVIIDPASGRPLRSTDGLKAGQELLNILFSGSFTSTVSGIEKEEE
jgi:exodeoxyribonuclease VII large subunit